MEQNQSILFRVAALILLIIGLVSFMYLLVFIDIAQLQAHEISFSFPLLSLGTMTLLLLVLSALLGYFRGVPVSLTFYALSLPLGFFCSATEYIDTLTNMDKPAGLAINLVYIMLPIVYAGVLCKVGYYFEVHGTREHLKPFHLKGNGYLALTLVVGLTAYLIFSVGGNAVSLRALMLLVSLCTIRLAIALLIDRVKGIQWNKMIGLIKDVGLAAVLFGAAYVGVFYGSLMLLEIVSQVGSVLAHGITFILYGLFIYSLGVTLALNIDEETVDWISRKNWHIAEAYTFVLFVTFSAQSLLSFL